MKILFFEMKKSWLRFPIFIVAILFCILDIMKIFAVYRVSGKMTNDESKDYRAAYSEIYDNILSGEVTDEKINYVRENLYRLRRETESGNFNMEYDDNTLTGHIYSDWVLFEFDFYPALEYIVTYPNISNGIASRAYENTAFYIEHDNREQAEKNYYIYTLYQDRKIINYNLTEWVRLFFEYDFSSLLIIIMIIIGLAPSFPSEKESGMDILIRAGGNMNRIANAKLISAAVYIFLLTLLFNCIDFVVIKTCCGADGLCNPLYSADYFEFSPFAFSLLSAILICALAKMLAFLAIGYIILLISNFTVNTILSLCTGFLTAVILIAGTELNSSVLSPVNMLSPYKMIKEFDCIIILGKPILSLYISLTAYLLIIILLAAAVRFSAGNNKRRQS